MNRPTGRSSNDVELLRVRSALFAPANRSALLSKLAASGADLTIADLEDGVPADDASKREARDILSNWTWPSDDDAPGPPMLVRINDCAGPWFELDVALVTSIPVAGVVVPKVDDVAALAELRGRLDTASGSGRVVIIAGIETAHGVANSEAIAQSDLVDAMYFGAEDFATDVGGRRTPGGQEVLYARSRVVLAAALGRLPALDQVVIDIRDEERFRADAATGRDLGYAGKMCIHPAQVRWAHDVFTPSAEEVEEARGIVEAAAAAAAEGHGVVNVHGRMIDAPLVARAERLAKQMEENTP